MIDRITSNEEKLDRINKCIKELNNSLDNFKLCQKDFKLLNKYYGSKNWFKDKDYYESGKINNIKAGVLSEDAVWNMIEEYNLLIKRIKRFIKK